jgi:hypothetical protein
MLAIFPQFIRPEWGPIPSQATVLLVITALTQLAVYSPPRPGRGLGPPLARRKTGRRRRRQGGGRGTPRRGGVDRGGGWRAL